MNNQTDKDWISVKKVGLPELEEADKYIHKSRNVLVQTKCGDMFVAYCEKKAFITEESHMKLNGFHMEPVEEE